MYVARARKQKTVEELMEELKVRESISFQWDKFALYRCILGWFHSSNAILLFEKALSTVLFLPNSAHGKLFLYPSSRTSIVNKINPARLESHVQRRISQYGWLGAESALIPLLCPSFGHRTFYFK